MYQIIVKPKYIKYITLYGFFTVYSILLCSFTGKQENTAKLLLTGTLWILTTAQSIIFAPNDSSSLKTAILQKYKQMQFTDAVLSTK